MSYLKRPKLKGRLTHSHLRSRKQEQEIADRIGGRRTAASGAREEKGDVRLRGVVRVEAKTTKHKSFSVTLDMIEKLENAALPCGELPVILVEFNDGAGKKLKEVMICPAYALQDIADFL